MLKCAKVIAVALLVPGVLLLAAGDASLPAANWSGLAAREHETRIRAFQSLQREWEELQRTYVDECGAIIGKNPEPALYPTVPKVLAIRLLGETRQREAVALLLPHIGYSPPEVTSEPTILSGKPVVTALIEIGLPAVREVLSTKTLTTADADALGRFALVVRYVFPDAKTARAFVAAYDPGYDAAAKAKHAQLQELLAKLP